MPVSRHQGGFTLIELLVVIGVIALLAGLSLPALSKAKMASETAKCKSNLKQIGVGFQMYVADFQRFPNGLEFTDPEFGQSTWEGSLRRYLNTGSPLSNINTRATSVFRCPAYDRISGTYGHEWAVAYAYNTEGATAGVFDAQGFSGVHMGNGRMRHVAEADLANPADMIVLADTAWYWEWKGGPSPNVPFGMYNLSYGLVLKYHNVITRMEQDSTLRSLYQRRHNSLSNTLYADGRVVGLSPEQLYDSTNERVLKSWNRSNLPTLVIGSN